MKTETNLFTWGKDFPAVCGQTSISFLKSCAGFTEAKEGDLKAATAVVTTCVKAKHLSELKKRYPNAELLPVMTENKLPIALAQNIGLKVCKTVSTHRSCQRKNMRAMERLLYQPTFKGNVNHNTSYILVDDILTQGGTVSALRKYVIAGGGNVVAVAVLAHAVGSKTLPPKQQTLRRLQAKFGSQPLKAVLQQYCIANSIDELTNQQAEYLLRFNGLSNIVEKICHTIIDPLATPQNKQQ